MRALRETIPGLADAPARRVALVISSLGGGGAERVLSRLANEWVRAGHAVTVVTIGASAGDVYALDPAVERTALDLLRPSRHLVHGMARGAGRMLALRRALTRAAPDVVLSFMGTTNVLCLLATLGSRARVFVCERTDPRAEGGRWSWSALRRLLYPRATGIVVQTQAVAGWARRFGPPVHVIPNSVEPPQLTASPGTDRGPLQLVAMGRLAPEKGFDLLVEAFARVADANPAWSLTILGEGPERARLEALVRARRLDGRVSLPGRARDPAPCLAAAHAFVLSSRREGFPNALIEAMACGLPAVAFDCRSGPSEIIEHERNGLLVPAGDVALLAAALSRILGDAAERARLGRNARGVAQRLAPERVLGAWNALVRIGAPA